MLAAEFHLPPRKSAWKRGVVKDCVKGNTMERKSCSCRLDSVTEAATAGKSCGVRLVQVRVEEVRLEEKQ